MGHYDYYNAEEEARIARSHELIERMLRMPLENVLTIQDVFSIDSLKDKWDSPKESVVHDLIDNLAKDLALDWE